MFNDTVEGMALIGFPLDTPAGLATALDELLDARPEPPALLALGEPTHGIAAFPRLRNDVLRHLVGRGFRWIALEVDRFAAALVDDYVGGGPGDVDGVLATGFTHGFGNVPGNRELLEWLRAHNEGCEPEDRVHCFGFDAPTEYSGAPSPRRFLTTALEYLPAAVRPRPDGDLDALLGADAEWENEAAMYDPAASVGGSDRARSLRVLADDLVSALNRAAPGLCAGDPAGFADAAARARTARGLLRYHAAMASPGLDRVAILLSVRAEMMAGNLLEIVGREAGPGLVFAHNVHLLRGRSLMADVSWASAGALVGLALGDRYLMVATDADPNAQDGTLPGVLAAATGRRALFGVPALRAALPPGTAAGEPMVPGHLPLQPAELEGADAVVFVADTDGKQHQYWT